MLSTIVVPLDGSAVAARALPYARRLARAGARLVLVRAHLRMDEVATMPTHYAYLPAHERTRLERLRAEADLHTAAQRLADEGLAVTPQFVEGPAAEAIVQAAASAQADLIVMSTHGRGGLGRLVFGSVADQVVRAASVPVLVVPTACTRDWKDDMPLRVLVPLDGSPLAIKAFRPAAELASALGGELSLLGVVEPDGGFYPDALVHLQADPTKDRADATRYLDSIARDLRSTSAAPVRVRVTSGGVAESIIRVASDSGADVVAMATHGRAGLARAWLGSVATATLERAQVPLLLSGPAAEPASSQDHASAVTSTRQD